MRVSRSQFLLLFVVVLISQWIQNVLLINLARKKEDTTTLSKKKVLPESHSFREADSPPILIYHPGPLKIATTSLQCALTKYQYVLLNEDCTIFCGKIPQKFCPAESLAPEFDFLTNVQRIDASHTDYTNANWKALTRKVEELYQSRTNIIFSDETHTMFHMKTALQDVPRHLFQNVFRNYTRHLVVGYRWYWQWWLSTRREYNRLFTPGRKRMQVWEGGRELDSMRTMLQHSYMTSHTRHVKERYEPYFHNVSILNIHEHKDIIRHLICQITMTTPATCRAYVQDHQTQKRSQQSLPWYNPSINVDLTADIDRLAMRAKQWINTTRYSRWHVVNETLQLNPRPQIMSDCPTTELRALLQLSLWDERALFNRSASKHHSMDFYNTSFCTVDINRTLPLWIPFFRHNFA